MADIKKGTYGYYYAYTDDAGKEQSIYIPDWLFNAYIRPGYLTTDMIDKMLAGNHVDINSTDKIHDGYIGPYTNPKNNRTSNVIYIKDKVDKTLNTKDEDFIKVKANLDKIVMALYTPSGRWTTDFYGPGRFLATLGLNHVWKTWMITDRNYAVEIINNAIRNVHIYTLKIYPDRSRTDKYVIYGYLKVEYGKAESITEGQFQSIQAKDAEIRKKINDEYKKHEAEKARIQAEVDAVRKVYSDWLDELHTIANNGTQEEKIKNLNDFIGPVSSSDDLLIGLLTSNSKIHFSNDLSEVIHIEILDVKYKINSNNYTKDNLVNDLKESFKKKLKLRIEMADLKLVRDYIYKQLKSAGLAATVEGVVIDEALDLGRFKEVKKILLKYKSDPEYAIVYNTFLDTIDKTVLKENILNFLKIYYDFYDMPEKDRKSIAKFIAKHKLSEYYDQIRGFDDVTETLIDNSRDPRLTKPILESIAGTSRADILKNKTYYFEKRGRLRSNIFLNKPIELIDRLKDCIKEFNASSGVAILTNIELDADESFIFQFYTFADGEGDDSEFDGRRMLNMTRIYNRRFASSEPDKKIGFVFDNESDEDSDDE